MAKTFDVLKLANEEAITVKLRDGGTLRAKDLLPEVIDGLGQIVDRRAREDASDEMDQRRFARVLQDDKAEDEAYAQASAELTQLITRSAQRGRSLVYEQMAVVFADESGNSLSVEFLQQQVPLPVARRIADELTRQILGRGEDGGPGNAPASDGAPTPTATTS